MSDTYYFRKLTIKELNSLEAQYLQRLCEKLCERVLARESAYVEAWLQKHMTLGTVFLYTLASFPHRPGYYELRRGDTVVSTLQVPQLELK